MKYILFCCCTLAVMVGQADVNDCYVRMTVSEYTNLVAKVDVLYAAHTNRLARVEAHKAKAEEHKRAIDRVKENERKHKSVMGKSVPTGKRSGGAK